MSKFENDCDALIASVDAHRIRGALTEPHETDDAKPDYSAAEYAVLALVSADAARNDNADARDAELYARRALAQSPACPAALAALVYSLQMQGRGQEMMEAARKIARTYPDDVDAQHTVVSAALISGDDAALFDAIWTTEKMRAVQAQGEGTLQAPLWNGENLHRKPLLLYHPYGWGRGDEIWFLRYLPLVVARGGSVYYYAPHGLTPLIDRLPGVRAITHTFQIPPHAFVAASNCIPGILGLSRHDSDTLNAVQSYLTADPVRVAYWCARLASDRIKVGIVWAGNPEMYDDARRSLPVDFLTPILDIPGVEFVSLQVGAASAALTDDRVRHVEEELTDYGETAAAIEALDLVISVDTSVAHLSGALGKPTWIMLPYYPDGRWGSSGDRARWYPSARLIRQPQPGDWNAVAQSVAAKLRGLVEDHSRAVSRPLQRA